jgi:hypothetical protein
MRASRRRIVVKSLLVLGSLFMVTMTACSGKLSSTNGQPSPAASQKSTPQNGTGQQSQNASAAGEATGSYTANGETVVLKYAYAGRGRRFGEDSIIVLVTDQPIPPEAVAEEIKSQTLLLDKKIRGLEYVFSKDGYWVRFHPSQYQESKSTQLKDYSVTNDVVKGTDEDGGELTNGKYERSVKFEAKINN